MAGNYLPFDFAQVLFKILMHLQKTSVKVIRKFAYYFVPVTILTDLVRITPYSSSANINIVCVHLVFIDD